MALALWLRRLPLRVRVWTRPTRSERSLLDADRFRFEAARERMRTDRNGSPLALLLIELPASRATSDDFKFVEQVLFERLRITDTPGVLSDRCVGVLLPDTPKSGAWKVASDVCGVYPLGHDRPNCEVYVYPDDDSFGQSDANQSNRPASKPARVQVKSLFVNDTPRAKRLIDLLGAAVGLTFAAPLMLLFAAAIKATSRGPVLYTQEREGLGGRRFRIYKFRTMRLGADHQQATLQVYNEQDGPAFKMSDDPRTTWVGRWLRRTSLDELPQLWNVLRGEMSLVGPRPLPTGESLQCAPWQRRRLTVVPGMTCIWQVWGRNSVPFDEWMRMDLQYIERRSLTYDLKLLAKTGPSILLSQGPR